VFVVDTLKDKVVVQELFAYLHYHPLMWLTSICADGHTNVLSNVQYSMYRTMTVTGDTLEYVLIITVNFNENFIFF